MEQSCQMGQWPPKENQDKCPNGEEWMVKCERDDKDEQHHHAMENNPK